MNEETQVTQTSNSEPKSVNPMMIGAIALVVLVAGFFLLRMNTGTTGSNSTADQMVTEDTATPEVEGTASADTQTDAGNVRTVQVNAGAFYYKPNVITVKKGETVKIVMTSDDMMHDFIIDELNVKIPITQSGNTNTVEFTADKVGTFEYYCSVGQHRKNGQIGKLIVEE